MIWIVIAFIAFLLLAGIARDLARSDPSVVVQKVMHSLALSLALFALALALAGRFGLALGPAAGAVWAWNRGRVSSSGGRENPPTASVSKMDRDEALAILGLKSGADEAAIRAAHRQLIKKVHPDQGGNAHLAAKINAAKELLLGD